MRTFFLSFLTSALLFACASKSNEDASTDTSSTSQPKLELAWETDTLLTTVEAVLYDEERDVIYTSNMHQNPWEKDGNGSIGKVATDGKIIDANWITGGLSAPKGMAIKGNKLFVADIDELVEIDLETNAISNKYAIEGADKLNDITLADDGTLYISDTGAGKVFSMNDGTFDTVLEGLNGPNGVLAQGKDLFVAVWNDKTFNKVNWDDNSLTTIASNIENPDGITPIGDGYFVSSWNGLVHHVNAEGETTLLVDTGEATEGAADTDFIAKDNVLLVPTFFGNKVAAYTYSE
ncbi:MAG: hypothetical protein KTR13_08820 [Saprospiraceae bacterium]|nr:hypothetical protein [Saprospiraceae bacterium]